jgi:Arc/MetJ-type ribon-helix-helix transcriptional regulator
MSHEKETDITTISIPKTLAEKIRKRMEGTGFRSVSSYVTYVLRQVISGIEIDEQKKEKEAFTKEDEEKVKERLRGLGYLD